MKLEGDYALDKALRVHRAASLTFAVGMACWYWNLAGGIAAFRMGLAMLLPLAFVWFSGALNFLEAGSERNARFIRWTAWVILVLICVTRVVGYYLWR
jgi:predicted ferric reductase